ncbi:hypothetical protein M405DRAFT_897003 [Rhizopogon salebrosus TDB-379]|nr:hypothetical protein M405DRAFT_897003 [Rhizopogon salebrosus TDB-379]
MKCYSTLILKGELKTLHRKLSLPDTTSWEQDIVQTTQCCSSSGCEYSADIVPIVHSLSQQLIRAINSERCSLSGSATELLIVLSSGLGRSFAPLVPIFFPTVLGLCARTNGLFIARAQACILAMIRGTQSPFILQCLADSVNHKLASVRLIAAEGVHVYLHCFKIRAVDTETRARLVEAVIKSTALDANADVQHVGKKILDAYTAFFPGKAATLVPIFPLMKT